MIILRKWYRIYQYRLTTKRCVMKKILIIVIWLLSMCCAFFAGGWTNQFAKDQYTMQDIASMMTTSFGWTIQSSKDVNAYQISLQDFCEMYNHLTNEDNSSGLAKSSGNIKGIDPHFLQESNIHIAGESKKAVYVYEFPLEFKMPEGAHLQSIVAFTDGEICMSAIHVQLDQDIIDQVDNRLSHDEVAEAELLPSTWPLNVDKLVVHSWGQSFDKLMRK